ncbi:hypothetical protein [Algoriphagus confluentis]|uniref:Uncharacterized protein n=1 Tax=Algoriphagus confluentis TaxID=1697556 RepID=A0ABQ6PUK7_9BACT|nr:hypothetical protein Aconfl_42520 [Algoriphagus confluentis]
MNLKIRLIFPIFFFLMLIPQKSNSGFLKKAFGGAVSLFVEKPINAVSGILGRGTSDYFTNAWSPSINNLKGSGLEIVAEFDRKFQERISQFDSSISSNLSKFDEILKTNIGTIESLTFTAIEDVDKVLSNRLNQFDEIIARNFNLLDTSMVRSIFLLEKSLIFVFLFGFILVMIILSFNSFVVKRSSEMDNRLKILLNSFIPYLIVLILVVGGLNIYLNSPVGANYKLKQIVENHEKGYYESFMILDFNNSIFHSTNLQHFNPLSNKYKALNEKARLFREIFNRPVMIKQNFLNEDVFEKLSQIQYYSENSDLGYDPDVDIVLSYIIFQNDNTRLKEYLAACISMNALKKAKEENKIAVFEDLAFNYLKIFSERPFDVDINFFKKNSSFTFEYYSKSEILDFYKKSFNDYSISNSSLSKIISYNNLVVEMESSIQELYLDLISISAENLELKQEKAREIKQVWNSFENSIKTDKSLSNSTLILNLFFFNDAIISEAYSVLGEKIVGSPKNSLLNDYLKGVSVLTKKMIEQESELLFKDNSENLKQFTNFYSEFLLNEKNSERVTPEKLFEVSLNLAENSSRMGYFFKTDSGSVPFYFYILESLKSKLSDSNRKNFFELNNQRITDIHYSFILSDSKHLL